MDERMRHIGDPTRQPDEKKSIPEIYRLTESGASDNEIALYLFREFNAHHDGGQIAVLAFLELQRRLPSNQPIFEMLARDPSQIGQVAQEILTNGQLEWWELETRLSSRERARYTTKIRETYEGIGSFLNDLYEYAKREKMAKPEILESIHRFTSYAHTKDVAIGSNRHKRGAVVEEYIVQSYTFGVNEPAYAETLGPHEILRLRALQSPRMALLGSYFTHSAREFATFCKKINQRTEPIVIDKDPECVAAINQHTHENGLAVAQMDALALENMSEMDTLFTNHLFHFLLQNKGDSTTRDVLLRFFKNAYAALNESGSLVVVEQPFGFDDIGGYRAFQSFVIRIAEECGFKPEKRTNSGNYGFPFRMNVVQPPDTNTGVQLNQYGFAEYGDKLLMTDSENNLYTRFSKQK